MSNRDRRAMGIASIAAGGLAFVDFQDQHLVAANLMVHMNRPLGRDGGTPAQGASLHLLATLCQAHVNEGQDRLYHLRAQRKPWHHWPTEPMGAALKAVSRLLLIPPLSRRKTAS